MLRNWLSSSLSYYYAVAAPGQAVTFTANVNGGNGAAAPTGVVQFYDNGALLAVVAVSPTGGQYTQAQAVYTTSSLALGGHVITAVYEGDAAFAASTAYPLTMTVQQVSTYTWLSASADPAPFGQAVTFTAQVYGGAGTPTGNITFKDGDTVLAVVALQSGMMGAQATFTTSDLSVGTHVITAAYSGDATFSGSMSQPFTETIE